jgi:hypothetical protein
MGAAGIVLACAAALAAACAGWVAADRGRNRRVTVARRTGPGSGGGDVRVLLALHEGSAYRPEDVEQVCAYVDGRGDCADFAMTSLLRIMLDHRDGLRPEDARRIERTILGFKYWLDEPGADSMCYWSENHQILFSAAELLAGGLYPDRLFPNAGLTGAAHRAKARARILDWLQLRWDLGFSEWYSNVYYVEDAAALANLIDFAADAEVVDKARIVMDLLLFDMASQSFQGRLVSSSGRLYEGGKKHGGQASTNGIARHAFGLTEVDAGARGLDANFILLRGYTVPPVLQAIARDPGPREIRASSGLDVVELRRRGLLGQAPRQIMAQLGMEAFTNAPVICNTLRLANRRGLLSNEFLHALKAVNVGLLWRTGLLRPLSALLRPQQDGVAIQRANTYTYRAPRFSMYTAQAHHPGENADQQHIHGVTLEGGLSLFTTHPARPTDAGINPDGTPDYWVGCGRLPCAAQEGSVTLVIYLLPRRARALENPILPFTHAWFPAGQMDESIVDDRFAFGRKGGGCVGITAGGPLRWADAARTDLVQDGRATWWVLEAAEAAAGGLEAFAARVRANESSFDGRRLRHVSAGRCYELDYGGAFSVDGRRRDLRYPRFDSAYARAPRDPGSISISHTGMSLALDFAARIRAVSGGAA